MAEPRVIVVGAGPAGVRCAEALADAGLVPIVIDESRRDGGQIYRRQPEGFRRSYATLYGSEAHKAQALHRRFDTLRERIDYRPDTLAWNVADGCVHVVRDGRCEALRYDALVICSGATDRVMPVKGWNLAGCYSLGAAQIALKAQACAIGRRVVFVGTGPLLYLVAAQYVKAGADVEAVLDTAPLRGRLRALAALAARPGVLVKGLALTARLRRSGVRIETGVTPVRITGSSEGGVDGIIVRAARGTLRTFACDAVALGHHVRPETQLADLARCDFRYDAPTRQWVPAVDADGRSSVAAVYLAGDGARVLGADGAEAAGRLAALAVLSDLGRPVPAAERASLRRTLRTMERFRLGLARAFPWPHEQAAELPDEAVVCRCETITAGELRRVVRDMGGREVNRAKAFSRVGMGRCQGRYCGHAAAEIVAAAAEVALEQVGRLRAQAPVKPLPISAAEVAA
jgi:NADPH-dependent 2,4-dienoyl-CoA reductase/sulfur reductase-like enzyme